MNHGDTEIMEKAKEDVAFGGSLRGLRASVVKDVDKDRT